MSEYRIVVVGSGGVGKSALTVRFIQGNFLQKYDPTIEDSYRKQVDVDGVACLLDILDTAGQEEYSALRDAYMKTGQGFVVVYDVTQPTSFDAVGELRHQILRTKEAQDIPIILAGNKCDLESKRQIEKSKGEELAKEWGCTFLETSALSDTNVAEMFEELVRLINAHNAKNGGGGGGGGGAGGKKKGPCTIL